METVDKKLSIALLVLRVSLGLIMFAHGAQKLLGWFGGYGFEGTMAYFTETVGLPYILALLVILAESFGAIALVFGLATRIMAASIVIIMVGAIMVEHLPYGFFINWFGNQKGEGFEFHLLVMAVGATLTTLGGGAYAVDAFIRRLAYKKRGKEKFAWL